MSTTKPFAEQAALFCLLAPLVAIAINVVTSTAIRGHAAALWIVGGVSVVLVLAGPVFGVLALLGMREHGTKGILGRSVGGIALSGICIMAGVGIFLLASRGALPSVSDLNLRKEMVGTWETRAAGASGAQVSWLRLSSDGTFHFRTTGSAIARFSGTWSVQNRHLYLLVTKFVHGNRNALGDKVIWPVDGITSGQLVLGAANGQTAYTKRQSADQKTMDELEHEYQIEQTGLTVYPTWLGVTDVAGARVVLTAHDDRAAFATEFRGFFNAPASLIQVVVDNTAGGEPIVLDPASAQLRNSEQTVVSAIPPQQILATAKEEKEKWLRKYSGSIAVGAGEKCLDRFIFIPQGTHMSQVTDVLLTVNGVETTVPGRVLSNTEMLDMYQRAKALQRSP